MTGSFSNGKSSIRLSVPFRDEIGGGLGLSLFPLVFDVDGIGLVRYPLLLLHCGYPKFMWNGNFCGFEYGGELNYSFQSGPGVLMWEIVSKPSWVTVDKQIGILFPGNTEKLKLTVSRGNMANGTYDGVIRFKHNSEDKFFDLRVQMKVFDTTLGGKVTQLTGQVVDADYCKSNGVMVLAMTNPNRLSIYRPGQDVSSLPLSNTPTAVAISETGDQIAYTSTNNDLSLIDPGNLTITKTIPIGAIPAEVVLGNNGWAYVAPKDYPNDYFRSINLNTNQVIKFDQQFLGIGSLRKIPGKDLLVASEWGYYFMMFDISSGAAASVVDRWSFLLDHYWLSEDGSQFFCEYRKIYKTPDYQNKGLIIGSPPLLGTLEPVKNSISNVEHSSALKKIFVVYSTFGVTADKIVMFDDAAYTNKGSITVNQCMMISNGYLGTLQTTIPWMFVNKNGTEMILIKKGNWEPGYWFYEKVAL
jgi:hypothetical protein